MTEQKKSLIQPGISVGNLILLGTILVSLAIGWGRLETGLADHDRRISENALDVKEAQRDLRQFNTGFAEIRTDMKYLIQEVARMRQTVERQGRTNGREP